MRTHTKFGIKIFELTFFFTYLTFDPSTGPQRGGGGGEAGQKSAVARHFHLSSPHIKFGWILCNGLGVNSKTDGQMDRQTEGQRP